MVEEIVEPVETFENEMVEETVEPVETFENEMVEETVEPVETFENEMVEEIVEPVESFENEMVEEIVEPVEDEMADTNFSQEDLNIDEDFRELIKDVEESSNEADIEIPNDDSSFGIEEDEDIWKF